MMSTLEAYVLTSINTSLKYLPCRTYKKELLTMHYFYVEPFMAFWMVILHNFLIFMHCLLILGAVMCFTFYSCEIVSGCSNANLC